MATHRLPATPATVRWGTFSASHAAALTVASGDTVVIECVSGAPEVMPPPGLGMQVPPALAAIHDMVPRGPGHILTGPVAVLGAEPGDMLEVRIEKITLDTDWGYCGFRPLAGTLPEDFPEHFLTHIPVDRARRTCRLPYGVELPLAPFFGVMGVAPPPAYGIISTIQPREHGGNLDNKELGEGATLYLPVWAPGALFSVGDGHGVQGDGEVCINALEMCLSGTFRLILHKRTQDAPLLTYPRAETATHVITMGMNEDLDLAMKQALREMIAVICSRTRLSRQQAYQFCSLAVDFRITQTVNGEKGVHGMLRKGLIF
ncbi:Acetamidase/formamidase family protein [Rhodovastum atsumiense]|uniref:Acetamidase/formamidase family protein n=1 Tax=Rhodovastum atsumiense TaxID=504468 RepID=A0A5M6IJL3_9PROT|nr:acetamidase/formamidase family protein [Rhodovastum atsumiense]KAA5608362.1 acetamidase/formamidase family protein [Rhodovastum atsumiense]CAH2600497.1 Acetamidase/formamidase family protein [Rhodovastum atsumiense]